MQKLLVTLGLWATLFGALTATAPAPAGASPTLPLPPPRMVAPDLADLKLADALTPAPLPFPFPLRAELSAEIATQPTGLPGSIWVICVVRNKGFVSSGPFQTLLSKVYVGTPSLPGPAV